MRLSVNGFKYLGFLILLVSDTLLAVSLKGAGTSALPIEMGMPWLIRLLSSPWLYVAGCCYLFNFIVWINLLKYVPIGPAFAATHLELIGVMAVSYYLYGQSPNFTQLTGAALIMGGIICLALDGREIDPA